MAAVLLEANAVCNLVGKAANLLTQVRDGWYKGSAELKTFKGKVLILKAKQGQWTTQLQRFGMMDDERVKPLVEEAEQILDKEIEYLENVQGSRKLRFKKKAFPGELTIIFDAVLAIVDAGPQLVASRVENHELLQRHLAQTPERLPFDQDSKYVPLSVSAAEVKKTLENSGGPRVVNLHAGPGMGKSSLLKYLALYYQGERTRHVTFTNGVVYLFCGKDADRNVRGLQLELLETLGFGDRVGPESNGDSTAANEQGGEYVHLSISAIKKKLRLCLAQQKLLIIIDDLLEAKVLEQLLVPGPGLKYLISSQNRAIWHDAEIIELKRPNMKDARKIMANYTGGLPTKGEFPKSVQNKTDAIIRKLDFHPLSLANIGLAVNTRKASDPEGWKVIEAEVLDHLKGNFHSSPVAYESTYPLKVGASMMLMVDSLPPEARRLLFLVALLEISDLPEVVVKYFLKSIQSTQFQYSRYDSYVKYLEERSVVEFRGRGGTPFLAAHGLRIHYIRENNTTDVRSVAAEILGSHGSSYHDAQLVKSEDAEETLVTIMGAIFYSKPFRDVVATKLKMQIKIFNEGVIPRSMGGDVDALDLVERTRIHKDSINSLVWLLNPDGESGWQQRAQGYAKKIIIRFVCRGELDDDSMAGLLRLPQTTSAASGALRSLYRWFEDYNKPFSSTHGETMKTLLSLLHGDTVATDRRSAAIHALGWVLEYESEDEILNVARKWVEFLGKDTSPVLQMAVTQVLSVRIGFIARQCPGLLEGLLALLPERKDTWVRMSAAGAIAKLSLATVTAVRMASIPGALEKLFHALLSECFYVTSWLAGRALARMSSVTEIRNRIKGVKDGLKGLVEVLVVGKLSDDDYEIGRLTVAATILGNLALEKELRETILRLSGGLVERLIILQTWPELNDRLRGEVARALTILDPVHSKSPTLTTVPPPPPRVCYEVYKGRAHAHRDMGLYAEALVDVDLDHQQLHQIHYEDRWLYYHVRLRRLKVFLKAMLEDYEGAMVEANAEVDGCRNNPWTDLGDAYEERGVLRRLSGNLPQALADLDEALQLVERNEQSHPEWFSRKYRSLMQRGYVKHLMEDDAGARADAESAQQLKLDKLVWEELQYTPGPHCLSELPFSYLGFTL